MAHNRKTAENAGWGRSDKKTFTIVAGNTGANVEAVDLGRNYAWIVVRCDDCSKIPAATTLGIRVADDEAQALDSLYDFANNTLTLIAPTLPTSGSMRFVLGTPGFGAQYVHFTLSKNASGGSVVFQVYGVAESVEG